MTEELSIITKGQHRGVNLECPHCHSVRFVRIRKGEELSKLCRKCFGELGHTDETKKKIAKGNTGKIFTQERRSKISKARMGHPGYMLGRHLTEEQKEKVRIKAIGRKMPDGVKEKLRIANTGRKHTDEAKAKIALAGKGRIMSETTKSILREANKNRIRTPEEIERLRNLNIGRHLSQETRTKISLSERGHAVKEETRDKIRQSLMGHPVSKETARKILEKTRVSIHFKPNQKEIKLLNLLQSVYPNEWAFVGDGKLIIDNKNPDYVNVNGKKLIIELFGDYWHRNENPQERIGCFRQFGFRTLVIWERELKDIPTVQKRIEEFVHG